MSNSALETVNASPAHSLAVFDLFAPIGDECAVSTMRRLFLAQNELALFAPLESTAFKVRVSRATAQAPDVTRRTPPTPLQSMAGVQFERCLSPSLASSRQLVESGIRFTGDRAIVRYQPATAAHLWTRLAALGSVGVSVDQLAALMPAAPLWWYAVECVRFGGDPLRMPALANFYVLGFKQGKLKQCT